jgi:aldehyde dehydrogenase (NAD+)
VVGQVVPWNFPLMFTAWKMAPALAAGNCIVLKPSEITPLTSLRIAELMAEAGLPPGVVNVRAGARQASPARISPNIRRWPRLPSPAAPPPAGASCRPRRAT